MDRDRRPLQELNSYKDPDWYGNDFQQGPLSIGAGNEGRPRPQ